MVPRPCLLLILFLLFLMTRRLGISPPLMAVILSGYSTIFRYYLSIFSNKMNTLFTILTAIYGLSSLASGGRVAVINQCPFVVYVWSGGVVPGVEAITLPPQGQHTELMYSIPGGVHVKVATSPNAILTAGPHTIFSYQWVDSHVWYGVNDLFGSCFMGYYLAVIPINPHGHECVPVEWPAGYPPGGPAPINWCNYGTQIYLYLCGTGDRQIED
ncbi:hypothetical protein TMatcc_010164 [Talaromyces marneffei ATCC 18224]